MLEPHSIDATTLEQEALKLTPLSRIRLTSFLTTDSREFIKWGDLIFTCDTLPA